MLGLLKVIKLEGTEIIAAKYVRCHKKYAFHFQQATAFTNHRYNKKL